MHVASVEKSYLENLNARLFALLCPWRRRMKGGPAGKRGRPEACRKSSSAYHGVTAGSLDTLEAFPSGVSALALRVAGGWLVKRHAGCAALKLCTPARLT